VSVLGLAGQTSTTFQLGLPGAGPQSVVRSDCAVIMGENQFGLLARVQGGIVDTVAESKSLALPSHVQ
jgi:hypothetical protein